MLFDASSFAVVSENFQRELALRNKLHALAGAAAVALLRLTQLASRDADASANGLK